MNYKEILEKAKKDLLEGQESLGKKLAEVEHMEKWITGLRQTIAALSRMLDEEFVEEDALGLTDAIREVFKSIQPGATLSAMEVRDRLAALGFDIKKYGNVMASVHAVITRLIERGEIAEATNVTRGDGKKGYRSLLSKRAISQAGAPITPVR